MPIQILNTNKSGVFTFINGGSNNGGFSMLGAEPSVSPTPSVSVTPSVTVSTTPSISVTPSITVSATPSISVTPSITVSSTPSISVTPSVTLSVTPSVTVTPSVSVSATPSPTVTPSITITRTPSVSVTPTPSTSAGPSIVTSGLVLNLDASNASSYPGSGNTWTDLTGNGNNMTMSGTVPINGSGQTKYFSYNGTANYFQGVNNFTTISSAITISIVASITNMSQRTALFSKYNGGASISGYVLEIGTISGLWTNTMRWYAAGTGGQSNDYRGTTALNANQIYVFTLTYDRGTGLTALYANSSIVSASQAGTNLVAADWSQGATPNLTGNYGPGLSIYSYMNQYMVLTYNRALTSTEVTQNYNALQSRFGI